MNASIWTVKELIEELNKYDGDLEVDIETFEGDAPIQSVEIVGKIVLIRPIN